MHRDRTNKGVQESRCKSHQWPSNTRLGTTGLQPKCLPTYELKPRPSGCAMWLQSYTSKVGSHEPCELILPLTDQAARLIVRHRGALQHLRRDARVARVVVSDGLFRYDKFIEHLPHRSSSHLQAKQGRKPAPC